MLTIVELIGKQQLHNKPCYRLELQWSLAINRMFAHRSNKDVDQAVCLALRLWLALNIQQEGEFSPRGAK
jgi:hypothetical protein